MRGIPSGQSGGSRVELLLTTQLMRADLFLFYFFSPRPHVAVIILPDFLIQFIKPPLKSLLAITSAFHRK